MGSSTASSNPAAGRRASRPRPRRARGLGLAAAAGLLLAAVAPAAGSLASALAEPVRAALAVSTSLGVHVVDVATGEEVYAFEPDRLRIPASNVKLATTAAALDVLGPGHFLETEVLLRGARRGGVLAGDMAVVGGGDPAISGRRYEGDSLAVFRSWAAQLKARGVERVAGDVYLVHGRFEPPQVHPDWPRDQLSRWYEAPVEALSFSDNCVLVRVSPGRSVGEPARVELVPELPLFTVRNRAQTTGSARQHWVAVERLDGSAALEVRGKVLRWGPPVETWVAVSDPVEYFGAALLQAFAEEGVTVGGRARPTPGLPAGPWERLAVHRSDLLSVAEVINKRSQNFFAESLLKAMGAEVCGEGSWQAGLEVVAGFLERIGIPPGSYELADGSGMSRSSRLTPRQLTTLLRHMFFHPRGQEYLLTLPYSGERDLKWEDRLADPPYARNVFAKTGSLAGVSTLSGYAKARSGRIYAFSILCNSTTANWRAQRAQDRILRTLIDHG